MYIVSQILNICSKNFLLNNICNKLKEKLDIFIDNSFNSIYKCKYIDIIMSLQEITNQFNVAFITNCIETIDSKFKNSPERKEKYHINKSGIERTIVTIFGTITFKRTLYKDKITGEYYFYLDDILNLESYKTYDSIIRAILVDDSVNTSPNNVSYHSSLNILNLKNYLTSTIAPIPRQTIYRFKRETKIRKVNYDLIPTNKTLYVMVDEKWIHQQDKDNPNNKKWIMTKCFVTFTGIERKGKRSRLIGKHTFITTSSTPWKDFTNEIHQIYNFEKIETINLLSDAGSWILSGKDELKFYSNNKVIVNTCEFHVKQKINRSTTDKELRLKIASIIYDNGDKNSFINEMDKLIETKNSDARKQKITEYKNYILKHWKGIINMKNSACKSSMEAHIEHCIASTFSSVPKAYSKNDIETYLKLQELKLNNINIFKYYLDTFDSSDEYVYNEKEVDFSIFDKKLTSNVPIINSNSPVSKTFSSIAHPIY